MASTQAQEGRPPVKADGGAVADEVDRRQAEAGPLDDIAKRITGSVGWFGRLLPPAEQGGIAPQAFAAQLLNMIRRNRQPAFRQALLNDPDSFFFAATDCAALNLQPAAEYWFVPFNDRAGGTGQHFTGMPGWKGELQQIYRSGSVKAVKFFVVYQGDHFRWLPTRMETPEYEPMDVPHEPQFLRRVVAYAEMHGGGISQVVVFGRYEIERAKASSKTPREFWESKWEAEMWLKTALHRLFDYVPHSAGYNTDLMRAWAVAAEQYPHIQLGAGDAPAAIAGGSDGPAPVPGAVDRNARPAPPGLPADRNGGNGGNGGDGGGHDEQTWPDGAQPRPAGPTIAGKAEPAGPPGSGEKITPSTGSKLAAAFQRHGWKGPDFKDRRRVVTSVIAAGRGPALTLTSVSDLTEEQGQVALRMLDAIVKVSGQDSEPVADKLQKLFDAAQAAAGEAARRAAGQAGPQE